MIRASTELNRTCDACDTRGQVCLLEIGIVRRTVRCCPKCWVKLDRARVQLAIGGVEAVEVG